jgi:hypothetical protein
MNYDKLPRSGKTLIGRLPKGLGSESSEFPIRPMTTQADVERMRRESLRARDSSSSSTEESVGESSPDEERRQTGEYVHFSLEKALLGTSPGLYHFEDHIAMLRRAEACSPGILPEFYLELAFGKELDAARALHSCGRKLGPGYFWYNPDVERPPTLLFSLQMHVDGVQVYENSEKAETMPILASIHELIPFYPDEKRADYDRGKVSLI